MKDSPGDFIPYEEVVKELKHATYGVTDLVDLGYFRTPHYVKYAVQSNQLKASKINKRSLIIQKDALLEYWKKYRSRPHEPAENKVTVKLAESELAFASSLVVHGQTKVDPTFSFSDLFRNILKYLQKFKISLHDTPDIFVKNI